MADNKQDHLNILIKVKNNPKVTQRELAKGLGISLGKLNYCLRELQQKGLLKLKNFQKLFVHQTRKKSWIYQRKTK